MNIERHGTTARYADAVIHNGVVYAVEVPASSGTAIERQARETLAGLEALLERAGSSKGHILMTTVYLVDFADLAGFNAVWEAWLPAGSAPTRVCVKVAGLVDPGWRVEVALTAALRAPGG